MRTGRSAHTVRAYRGELGRFVAVASHRGVGPLRAITPEDVRAFLVTRAHLAPATRARSEAALAAFLAWARRAGHLEADPMARVERVRLPPPAPRGVPRADVEAVLGAVPRANERDRLLFGLVASTGLRIGEALGLHVEDLDLSPDDEHASVLGKGGRRRTVLLDDDRLVKQLRAYLKATGYRHGPLFRAEKNGRGGPLRYQSAQARWARYCRAAGVEGVTLHRLRHAHATELVDAGVSLATIRKRLGHRDLRTTLRYAEQSDAVADAEVRAWRRARRQQPERQPRAE